MRGIRSVVLVLGCSWLTGIQAQEAKQPVPDLEFLEYLGAWADEDDEWLAIEEWEKDEESTAPDDERDASGKQEEGDDEDE